MIHPKLRVIVETWILVEAVMFVIAEVAHSGIDLPYLHEPQIVPAAIIEAVCALMLAAVAHEVRFNGMTARRAALAAHGVAISAVALGMFAVWLGLAPYTPIGMAYYRGLLGVLGFGFFVLALPWARTARESSEVTWTVISTARSARPEPRMAWREVS